MSKREDLEARIREQRVLEANKKGLVGVSGKIGVVLRVFGHEVISQWDDGYLDYYEEDIQTENDPMKSIPTMEMEGNQRPDTPEWGEIGEERFFSTRKIGIHFDGLGFGMHMEIMYKDESSELSLTHKGILVYRESMGEIDTFVPNEEWEGWVERLYKRAKAIQRKDKEIEFESKAAEAEKEKANWWESIKKRWGSI